MIARALGGPCVVGAISFNQQTVEWAKGLGASHTVNPLDAGPVAQVKSITGGRGVENDREEAKKRPFRMTPLPQLRRLDGSFTNW